MSSNNKSEINKKHIRYRMQRLIKLGEWVEKRESILRLASNSLHSTFCDYMDDDNAYCMYTSNMEDPIDILNDLQLELRRLTLDEMPSYKEFNGKVVLTHRYACKEHKEKVLLEDLTQDELDVKTLVAVNGET